MLEYTFLNSSFGYFPKYFVSLLFLRLIPSSQIVDSNVLCIWNIDVYGQSASQNGWTFPSKARLVFVSPHPYSHRVLSTFIIFASLIEAQWYITVLTLYISLVFTEVECVLCVYWPLTFPSINCPFIYTWPIFTLSDWFVWVLYKWKALLALLGVLCTNFPEFIICLYDKFCMQKCFIFI